MVCSYEECRARSCVALGCGMGVCTLRCELCVHCIVLASSRQADMLFMQPPCRKEFIAHGPQHQKWASCKWYTINFYHTLLRRRAPFASIRSLHRVGISLMRRRIDPCVTLLHSCIIASLKSSTVNQLPPRSRSFIIIQIGSIGFRSGDYAGCSRVVISASFLSCIGRLLVLR
jgi:hypothetical protein